jgi:cell division initiation protein
MARSPPGFPAALRAPKDSGQFRRWVAGKSETGLRITPLDIRNHAFPRRVSGYDRDEVDAFLRMVADDYEAALRVVEAARAKVRSLEARVTELSSSEQLLKETLTTAQQLSVDLKQTAMKEAEILVSQAEIKGEKVLEAAHRRAAQLAEDIREMKRLRARLAGALRGTIERHLEMVEQLSEEPPAEDPELEARVDVIGRAAREPGRGGV